jgi:methylated-DNA-protein-cysteine methyltransferase-like protein
MTRCHGRGRRVTASPVSPSGASGQAARGPGQAGRPGARRPNRPASDLTRRIRAILAAIPAGTVATYGQVAALAGNPRAARAVVWVLRRGDAPDAANGEASEAVTRRPLPWHRVINSRGTISLPVGDGFELQRALLLDEGVSVTADGRVDLGQYLWDGRGGAG